MRKKGKFFEDKNLKQAFFCGLFFFITTLVVAQDVAEKSDGVPDPLSLEQALTFAAKHPRTQAGAVSSLSAYPRRHPLYLDCHSLAYNNVNSIDNARNHSFSPLLAPLAKQQLVIMLRFFDVLLADLSSARDNENMAVVFIALDRARTRQELGQYSELRVAALEARYQIVRQQRSASETSLRLTRSLLAQALNHPLDLPGSLVPPETFEIPKELPELQALVDVAQKENAWLKQLKSKANATEKPLIDMDMRQQILELLLRLQVLKAAADRAESELLWRDLKLEQSRTLYEQEVKADLGDSMTQQTRARLQEQQVVFCQALTWFELEALQGRPILQKKANKDAKESQAPEKASTKIN